MGWWWSNLFKGIVNIAVAQNKLSIINISNTSFDDLNSNLIMILMIPTVLQDAS